MNIMQYCKYIFYSLFCCKNTVYNTQYVLINCLCSQSKGFQSTQVGYQQLNFGEKSYIQIFNAGLCIKIYRYLTPSLFKGQSAVGTSLVVQRLRPCPPTAGNLICGPGTKVSHATQHKGQLNIAYLHLKLPGLRTSLYS